MRPVNRDKAILCCALSGVVANKSQCPAIPYTPEEYGEEARRAYEAGAAMVHIHARERDGSPSYRKESYAEIRDAILERCPDIVINFSTGAIGVPLEQRIHHVRDLKPDVGALNMGSMNYAKYNPRKKAFVFDFVFANPFSEIVCQLEAMRDAGVLPELECFDGGHVSSAYPLIDMGLLRAPYHFSLIMGVIGGAAATTESLVHEVSLLPDDSNWEVIGVGRDQWRLCAGALSMAGDVRVGLEDNFYLPDGRMAGSNGDLCAAAASLIRLTGREPATPAEAREIYGIARRSEA